MNARERVLCAIARQQPDRTPRDFSANRFVLARLAAELGTTSYRALLERLQVDIVDLRGVVDPTYRGLVPLERLHADGSKENLWGMRTRVMETATGPEECHCAFALDAAETLDELERHPWPRVDWFDFTDFADRLCAWDGFAVMASGASVFQHPTLLRGIDAVLMDCAGAPEMAHYVMDRFTDFYLAFFDRMFTAAPGRIDLLRIADDLGMQDRLLISPATFAEFVAPRLTRLIDMAHSHGVKVMFHSCGCIVPFISALIDIGVDVLDPIQVHAAEMDPATLKSRFGDRLCFHGAIDTQYLLPHGTPDDVAAAARAMTALLGANGGYILAPSHTLQVDVPTANILALYA